MSPLHSIGSLVILSHGLAEFSISALLLIVHTISWSRLHASNWIGPYLAVVFPSLVERWYLVVGFDLFSGLLRSHLRACERKLVIREASAHEAASMNGARYAQITASFQVVRRATPLHSLDQELVK